MYWWPLETAQGHKQTSISRAIRERPLRRTFNTLVTATLSSGSGDLKGPPHFSQPRTFRLILKESNGNTHRHHFWLPDCGYLKPLLP